MDLSTELGKSYSWEWVGKKFAKAGVKIRGSPEWVGKKFAKAGVKIRGSLDWVEKKFAEAGVKIRGSLDWVEKKFAKAGVKIPGALDWVEKKFAEAGVKIREVLLDRVSLLLLSVISSIAVLVCLLQTKNMASRKKLWILVGFFSYIGLGLGFHRILNKRVTNFCHACSTRYPNLYIIVRCIGILLVLLGFVYLTKFIEKHEGWNGYALGFYLSCYLHLIVVMKLYGREDFFGASDSILAVTVTIFLNLTDEQRGYWPWVFLFVTAFLLLLLKLSRPVIMDDQASGRVNA